MSGINEYNKNFYAQAQKRILDNKDKKYLEDFYYFLLADTSYSGSYGYLGCVINFVDKCNIKKIEDIRLSDYTRYMATIKDKSSSYKIMVYSALKKFSSFLKANGMAEDYMSYVKRPKFKETQQTKDKRENGFMDTEEVAEFIGNIKKSDKSASWKARDLAMATILLNTGIRCSALQKLDVNDIDLEKHTVRVLEKGNVSRVVYISDVTIKNVTDWIAYRNSILTDKKETALFISDRKTRITRRTIYNLVKGYGSSIEGKNITPHKTRGTYGTQLYEKTHDLYFVQDCMGHTNPKTTELYIRGNKGTAAQKASELMSTFLE